MNFRGKILLLVAVLVLALMMVACGSSKDDKAAPISKVETSSVAEESSAVESSAVESSSEEVVEAELLVPAQSTENTKLAELVDSIRTDATIKEENALIISTTDERFVETIKPFGLSEGDLSAFAFTMADDASYAIGVFVPAEGKDEYVASELSVTAKGISESTGLEYTTMSVKNYYILASAEDTKTLTDVLNEYIVSSAEEIIPEGADGTVGVESTESIESADTPISPEHSTSLDTALKEAEAAAEMSGSFGAIDALAGSASIAPEA